MDSGVVLELSSGAIWGYYVDSGLVLELSSGPIWGY